MNDKPWYLIEYTAATGEAARWWTGLGFHFDANQAARFPLRYDAEAAVSAIDFGESFSRARIIVTEHLWMEEGR